MDKDHFGNKDSDGEIVLKWNLGNKIIGISVLCLLGTVSGFCGVMRFSLVPNQHRISWILECKFITQRIKYTIWGGYIKKISDHEERINLMTVYCGDWIILDVHKYGVKR